MEIKNIVLAGASGSLGKVVLEALIAANKSNVTVFSRTDSEAAFPDTVQVRKIDYTSVEDLTSALTGQDAVICTFSPSAVLAQIPLIHACVAAGVKRIIPSEFTADISNPNAAALPQYAPQLQIHSLLQEVTKANPKFSYTSIRNGVFLDWGLALGFQVDFRSDNPPFYDGGDRPFSTTTLGTVARAVVAVLDADERRLGATRNKALYVHDVVTTQRQLLGLARGLAPGRKWDPVAVSTEEMERVARENYGRAKRDLEGLMGLFVRAVFGEGFGGCFGRVDNELLGLGFMSEGDLERVIEEVLA
ncbi:aromatic alcohol reductase [Aspergillus undulatus]|uniref:aromatic alcohol reductase n=1 Tax=Aspergillus undulatus TaxID=1810928 RepID=UPI003CCCE386